MLIPFRPDTKKPVANEEEDGEVQDSTKSQPSDPKTKASETSATENLPPKPTSSTREVQRKATAPSPVPARSSTPKAAQSAPPGGPRNDNRANALPDRPPHNLPTRPDVPIPGHFERNPPAQPRNHERRDARDPRDNRGGRESRDAREPREARDSRESRDPREGWPADVEWADRNRDVNERRGTDNSRDANRTELMPRAGAQDRERPHRGGRTLEPEGTQASPATQQSTPSTLEPAINPERAAMILPDAPSRPSRGQEVDSGNRGRRQQPNATPVDKVNPQRAALIGDGNDNTPTRPPREDPRDRGPRGHSPRRASGRYGQEQMQAERGHDERMSRPHPADHLPLGRQRGASPPPGSFRGERPVDNREVDRMSGDKGRDASGFHRPASRGHEYDYRAQYEDQSYGRLNPVQSIGIDVPSGPRGRGGRPGRGGHPNHGGHGPMPPGPDNRYGAHNQQRPASPERHPPSGPSGRNNPRRSGYDPPHGPLTPGPSGPAHGDRMRNASINSDMPPPASGVHPDRLAQMGSGGNSHHPPPPPPPPSGPAPHGDSRHHQMPPTATPDRPKGDSRSTPGNLGPPAPESGERGRSGGSRRQLAGINNMLQANKPEPSSRSSSRRNQPRQMLANTDVQVLTGGSPVSTPVQERPDPIRYDASGKGNPNGEDAPKEDGRGGREREGRSERSSRSSRRSSRDRDRERSPTREKENKEHRDYRDRRSGAGTESSNREERETRRSSRGGGNKEHMGPPLPQAGGKEHVGGGGGRHRGDKPGMKPGDDWGSNSGRGNRGPPKEGGPRQDERGDRSRKRRSEDGTGGPSGDREKRQRR